MEKITVEGIVLNETNYGETSKILNVLTKDYGYISIMSKGCRVLKSKLRGISMKLVLASFTINYKENGISLLLEGNTIDSLKYILTDFKKMNYAMYLTDITKSILKDYFNPSIYVILKNALIKINNSFHDRFIIIDDKILYHSGASFKDLGKKCFAINKIDNIEMIKDIKSKLSEVGC